MLTPLLLLSENFVMLLYIAKNCCSYHFTRTVFLNLFYAVALFKGPENLAAHFNENFNEIITMTLGKHKITWQRG